ncbi:unnamed protein product [Brugia timori]|uniref:Uncharacterized protein n=1 Tax=Brugia timori TaxID=42155 RepID=A0A0R3RAG8_9BILA|nr:unnamed protein product [Brugia timori]
MTIIVNVQILIIIFGKKLLQCVAFFMDLYSLSFVQQY